MKTLFKYSIIFFCAFCIAGATGYLGVTLFTKSAPEIILPDLVGKNIIQVLETLTRLGLNPKLHATQYHETIPKYGVIFQDPQPGTTIKKGRDVVIYLSKGFKESKIPDLRRVMLKQGLLHLEAKELKAGKIIYVSWPSASKNTIIGQYPLPNTLAAANTSCDLLVSKGPKALEVAMPDLKDLTLEQAAAQIEASGLVLEKIKSKTNSLKLPGLVLDQAPSFGSRVTQGDPIHLIVNESVADRIMNPNTLNEMVWVSYSLPPGFANRHVRVSGKLFDRETNFINTYMKPGKKINLLIPGGIKTKIRLFVDHKLMIIRDIDPWQNDPDVPWFYLSNNTFTGEFKWQ